MQQAPVGKLDKHACLIMQTCHLISSATWTCHDLICFQFASQAPDAYAPDAPDAYVMRSVALHQYPSRTMDPHRLQCLTETLTETLSPDPDDNINRPHHGCALVSVVHATALQVGCEMLDNDAGVANRYSHSFRA